MIRLQRICSLSYTHFFRSAPRLLSEVETINYEWWEVFWSDNTIFFVLRSKAMSVHPYQSAYQGVFSTRSHIKEYLSWFAGWEEPQQQSLVTPASLASEYCI